MSSFPKSSIRARDLLDSEIGKENTILVQTGDANAGVVTDSQSEWWQQIGLASRPPKVSGSGDNKEAGQAIVLTHSDYDICIASRDTRYQEIWGALKYGETCLYAAGETGTAQARIVLKNNGSINLFTKQGNTDSGAGMGIFIDSANKISIVNGTGKGVVIDSDAVKMVTSASAVSVGSDISLTSSGKIVLGGGSIVIGGPSALPVINVADILTLIPLIAAGISAAGPGGPAAASTFTSAATAAINGLSATKRTWAD